MEVPGCTAAERTVRQYVERRKQELGSGRRETFVPQSYEFGVEVQIGWSEAYADLDDEWIKLQVFSTSMASGAAYHRAHLRATQQAFLEAHELAFHYFGEVLASHCCLVSHPRKSGKVLARLRRLGRFLGWLPQRAERN
ncbi:MAG: hypothetical protein RB191_19730 [Terriglobia bacterium]|nr:hypothetical protein [Terriglobia bacterium]